MVGKPLFGRAMTPAERQRRHRAMAAAAPNPEAQEALHGLRRSLGKLAHYLTIQGDPKELGAVLATLDGPPLPAAMLAEATAWLTQFTEAYRYGTALQQTFATPTPKTDPDP